MKDERYLIKISQRRVNRIIRFIKKIFWRNKYNNTIQNEKQLIESLRKKDLEVLKEIIKGTVNVKSLDIDTKKRLIKLCDNRLKEITKTIDDKTIEIKKMEKILDNNK